MELKKGMYVKDEYKGIGKVIDICTCEQCQERGFYEPIISYAKHTEYVSSYNNMQLYEGKASHNIIDLLQVGDYVNGSLVEEVGRDRVFTNRYYEDGYYNSFIGSDGDWESSYVSDYRQEIIYDYEIKSIVTKEQFEQMEYKVGE